MTHPTFTPQPLIRLVPAPDPAPGEWRAAPELACEIYCPVTRLAECCETCSVAACAWRCEWFPCPAIPAP